jgi:L-ascorbate metabolism protein UlaG (beta-lactamase superfamily)
MAQPSGKYNVSVTYLWRSAFKVVSPEGKILILDPWLANNPYCPEEYRDLDKVEVDVVAATHPHTDHNEDVVPLAKKRGAHVVCTVDTRPDMEAAGLTREEFTHLSFGGTEECAGMKFSYVPAWHANGGAGIAVRFSSGFSIYHGGDTNLFTDMELIRTLYKPNLALLPIGDRFTMDPYAAGLACKMYLQCEWAVPHHYPGNWRDPAQWERDFEGEFIEHLKDTDTEPLIMKAGDTILF